ncbi:MAG: tRNA epoxyqueuosine(34) reductase QueG [Acidimicrobiales bacterium]|nr:tRNA epoxyqueuosine(34) reductase QueG [Acidimicrobiales bacterium]
MLDANCLSFECYGSVVMRIPNLENIRQVAKDAGLDDIAVTGVEPLIEARVAIKERKRQGLHAGMNFTYGNPERATDPAQLFEGAQSILVAVRRYKPPSVDEPQTSNLGAKAEVEFPKGVVASYVCSDEYGMLRQGLTAVANYLEGFGARAEVVMDDNRLADRAVAARAGLGWLGRNTMLLHPELGSWTVIGSVVTDAPIEGRPEKTHDGCGSCRRCSTDCPTGAIDEFGVLDANKCLAWLLQAKGIFPRQYRTALGDRLYGCDDCQVLCPINDETMKASGTISPEDSKVDIVALLDSSDEELMKQFGHWYIPRRRPEYLRRNALIVLGNSQSRNDSEVDRVLANCLISSEPLVRSHAVWAALRLGKGHLIGPDVAESLVEHDPDGIVRAELDEWGILLGSDS